MPPTKSANYRRVDIEGTKMWLLLYNDGRVKLAQYNAKMEVEEVLNRKGGAHVIVSVKRA